MDARRNRARGRPLEPHGHAEGVAGLARNDAAAADVRGRRAGRGRPGGRRAGARARSCRSCPPASGWWRTRARARVRCRACSRGWRRWRPRWRSSRRRTCRSCIRGSSPRCARAARDADAAVPHLGGFRQPLAAAYRTALTPLVGELVARADEARVPLRALRDPLAGRLPHPESVRNLNAREDYDAALAEPQPAVHVRCFGPLRRRRPRCARRPRRGRRRGRRHARRARARGAQRRPDRPRPTRAARRGRQRRVHGRRRRRMSAAGVKWIHAARRLLRKGTRRRPRRRRQHNTPPQRSDAAGHARRCRARGAPAVRAGAGRGRSRSRPRRRSRSCSPRSSAPR